MFDKCDVDNVHNNCSDHHHNEPVNDDNDDRDHDHRALNNHDDDNDSDVPNDHHDATINNHDPSTNDDNHDQAKSAGVAVWSQWRNCHSDALRDGVVALPTNGAHCERCQDDDHMGGPSRTPVDIRPTGTLHHRDAV